MDTDTTIADLVVIDADNLEIDTDSFSKEFVSNTAIMAASAGAVVVGVLAYRRLKPRVVSLLARSKNEVEAVVVADVIETPPTEN